MDLHLPHRPSTPSRFTDQTDSVFNFSRQSSGISIIHKKEKVHKRGYLVKKGMCYNHQSNFDRGLSPEMGVAGFTPLCQQSLQLPLFISLDSWHPFSPNQHSCSPSPLASSTSSFVVLTSSCPSLQTPTLLSKHAHHLSSTHARTISLCSPLPSEPL